MNRIIIEGADDPDRVPIGGEFLGWAPDPLVWWCSKCGARIGDLRAASAHLLACEVLQAERHAAFVEALDVVPVVFKLDGTPLPPGFDAPDVKLHIDQETLLEPWERVAAALVTAVRAPHSLEAYDDLVFAVGKVAICGDCGHAITVGVPCSGCELFDRYEKRWEKARAQLEALHFALPKCGAGRTIGGEEKAFGCSRRATKIAPGYLWCDRHWSEGRDLPWAAVVRELGW